MTQTEEQFEVLLRMVDLLDAIGIDYMLTGSMALNLYDQPRMTRDIDIVIEAGPQDVPFLERGLSQEFTVFPDTIREAVTRRSMFNVIDARSLSKVDLIIRDKRMNPDEVFARRRRVEASGREVKVISPEDLILSKLQWARESRSAMQFRDVHRLLRIPDLDQEYISLGAAARSLSELLAEALDERYES